MLGMSMMGQSVLPLREYQGFVDFIGKFSHNPILGIGVGIVMTVLIQSSSATIGILIAMASRVELVLFTRTCRSRRRLRRSIK